MRREGSREARAGRQSESEPATPYPSVGTRYSRVRKRRREQSKDTYAVHSPVPRASSKRRPRKTFRQKGVLSASAEFFHTGKSPQSPTPRVPEWLDRLAH